MAPTLESNQMKNKFILFTSLLLLSACSESDKSSKSNKINQNIIYKQAKLNELSIDLIRSSTEICKERREKYKNSACVVIYLKNGVRIPKIPVLPNLKEIMTIYRLQTNEEIGHKDFRGWRFDCETFKRQGAHYIDAFCLSTQEDLNNFLSPYLKN